MSEWIQQIWEKSKNPYIRAIALFVIVFLGGLALASTISDTGFAQEVQSHRVLVWVGSGGIALFAAIGWLLLRFRKRKNLVLFHDAQNGTAYLMDLNGKAREIPDDHTFTFSVDALGIFDDVPEMSTKEIARLRGERLTSIKDWERPLTPDEQAKRELRRQVGRALEITKWCFDETTDPQRIVVQITNCEGKLLHIKKVKFQHRNLPDVALLPSYLKDGTYTVIPFDQSNSNIAPGAHFVVELELSQKWQRSDIERTKGQWGFLLFDIVYEGEPVDGVLLPI